MAQSKTTKDSTLYSDTEKGDLCAACAVDRDYRSAVKFCMDCSQPICQSCVDSHRKIKMIQGHKLVDNRNGDAVKVAKTLSSCLACPNHANKTIEFICVDHDAFCCSTCATVNHRSCHQVKEVATLAQLSTDITNSVKHIADAKAYIEVIVNFRQQNNQDVQLQASKIIPKQIQEMKASVMKTFDELETLLLRETRKTADIKVSECIAEIAKWQSHIETVNRSADVLSVTQENGTDVHKYIAAKNIGKKLSAIDNDICQARGQLKSEHLSFSFDKGTLLQNAYVAFNNVNKSLAEIDDPGLPQKQQPTHSLVYPAGCGQVTESFAKISVVTKQVKTSNYPYGQAKTGFYFGASQRNF